MKGDGLWVEIYLTYIYLPVFECGSAWLVCKKLTRTLKVRDNVSFAKGSVWTAFFEFKFELSKVNP